MEVLEPTVLPDGSVATLAVPEDDDCIPSGAWLLCPMVRLVTRSADDGAVVVGMWAYDRMPANTDIGQVREATHARWGASDKAKFYPEWVRGQLLTIVESHWSRTTASALSLLVVLDSDDGEDARWVRGVGVGVAVTRRNLSSGVAGNVMPTP